MSRTDLLKAVGLVLAMLVSGFAGGLLSRAWLPYPGPEGAPESAKDAGPRASTSWLTGTMDERIGMRSNSVRCPRSRSCPKESFRLSATSR